ncbi:MAG: hypothetical protein ACRDI2_13495 [Chloroflexota bacterium]
MGFIKQQKQQTIGMDAERALAEGRTVFAPRLNAPTFTHQLSGSVSGWAEQIEAIEIQGWALWHWAVGLDQRGKPEAYPLFRPAR